MNLPTSTACRALIERPGNRVYRFPDEAAMLTNVFVALTQAIVEIQERQQRVQLAVGGGRTMRELFETMARLGGASRIDSAGLELWWVSERYVAFSDPDRNSTQALGQLAKTFAIVPAQIHAMPMTSTTADAQKAAQQYGAEIGERVFDLCVVGMGAAGEVGAIYPDHPSLTTAVESSAKTFGVSDPPSGKGERISLTFETINSSREVWILASGQHKAVSLQRALSGDPALPAAHLMGKERTRWFVDEAAASELTYYQCQL